MLRTLIRAQANSLRRGPVPRSILDDSPVSPDLSEDPALVDGIRPGTPPLHQRTPPASPTPSQHAAHRAALRKTFPAGWAPPRKLSRDAMDGLRALHRFDPEKFSTPILADKFRISPEAVRRILKSRWTPPVKEKVQRDAKEREARAGVVRLSRIRERVEAQKVLEAKDPKVGGRDSFTFE
ncbi:Neugrin-domain-containing protein, partial [Infundibulicybe gibba]